MDSDFTQFLQSLMRFGLEYFRRYYGQYRATVTSNKDPEERHRVQAYCPAVGQTKTSVPDVWIEPAMTGAGEDRGMFWPPEEGDSIWVSFAFGDPDQPNVYWGGWYGYPSNKTEAPGKGDSSAGPGFQYSGGYPERRGLVTRMGHVLQFVDEAGSEAVRLIWHKPSSGDPALSDRSKSANRKSGKWSMLSFEKDGDVQLVNQNGSLVHLDASNKQIKVVDENGNSVVLGPAGIQAADKNQNFITMTASGVSAVTGKNVSMQAGATFGIQAGGVNVVAPGVQVTSPQVVLGSPAAIPVVKHTPWLPLWQAVGGVAQGLSEAGKNSPATPVLLGALVPFMEPFAKLAQAFPSLLSVLVRVT